MLLIIDCRVNYDRRNTLVDVCMKRDTDVRSFVQVWGDAKVDDEQIWPTFDALIETASLVLLHVGADQLYPSDALRRDAMRMKNCIAFYGGANADTSVKQYFDENPSQTHALIEEPLVLALKANSSDAEKLGNCLDLILTKGLLPPVAVERVYGDPDLERALDELYKMLAEGQSITDIRTRRDQLLPQDPWGEPC